MAKVITSNDGKYYSPITYDRLCLDYDGINLQGILKQEIHDIIDKIYPIGAYYISTDATSPADLFNYGNWELLADGNTILGSGANDDISEWETKTLADGSKWVKIYYQQDIPWTEVMETDTIYDRLAKLSWFYTHESGDSGHIELMLEYENLGLKGRWKQRAYPSGWSSSLNIASDMLINRTNYTATSVEEGCYLPPSWSTFRGLGVSNSSNAQISGCQGESTRLYGLRITAKASSESNYLIAASNEWESKSVTLWARFRAKYLK